MKRAISVLLVTITSTLGITPKISVQEVLKWAVHLEMKFSAKFLGGKTANNFQCIKPYLQEFPSIHEAMKLVYFAQGIFWWVLSLKAVKHPGQGCRVLWLWHGQEQQSEGAESRSPPIQQTHSHFPSHLSSVLSYNMPSIKRHQDSSKLVSLLFFNPHTILEHPSEKCFIKANK